MPATPDDCVLPNWGVKVVPLPSGTVIGTLTPTDTLPVSVLAPATFNTPSASISPSTYRSSSVVATPGVPVSPIRTYPVAFTVKLPSEVISSPLTARSAVSVTFPVTLNVPPTDNTSAIATSSLPPPIFIWSPISLLIVRVDVPAEPKPKWVVRPVFWQGKKEFMQLIQN